MRILFLALIVLASPSSALHCLSHSHCGENAVCVTKRSDRNPKCMCLLGYQGNGASCLQDGQSSNSSSTNRRLSNASQNRVIVVSKCDNDTASTSANASAGGHHGNHHGQHANTHGDSHHIDNGHEHHVPDVLPDTLPQANFNAIEMEATREDDRCYAVECNFERDSCLFMNDQTSHWRRKQIHSTDNGHVLVVVGYKKTNHYLMSGPFRLTSPAVLIFDYFESSRQRRHLRVASNSVNNTIWRASGAGAGWRKVATALAAGQHRLIFGAERLNAVRLVALDNIQLQDFRGEAVVCS